LFSVIKTLPRSFCGVFLFFFIKKISKNFDIFLLPSRGLLGLVLFIDWKKI